ncbi:MAG TPA: sporulation protein YabP [Clostridia bacterium]|jgi:sporulation protein YabP|nr:sporulation protein YabP [Clostridia bacterium]
MEGIRQHQINLNNRAEFAATGVSHVDNYDDKLVTVETEMGTLIIKGEGLNINNLNLNEGTLEISGRIDQLTYSESQGKKARGMLQKIFK